MENKYILALDQGTTSSRAIVFNKQGEIMGLAQQEFPQIYPETGWVEHDTIEILSSQLGVISEALIRAKTNANNIAAIGITNQRETTVVWNKETGIPIYNAIVWQCRRTAAYCEELKQKGYSEMIYNKTGLVIDAYFSATKIKWILDNVEGARDLANEDKLAFGTIDSYLLWNLTKEHVHATDYSNASRTMLFNIHTLEWDDELLELFDIPASMLPKVCPSSHLYGYTNETKIGARIPISGIVGDQQAALFGQLCVNKGDVKNTYGTGCFMLMNTKDEAIKSQHGLVTTLAASINDKPDYALEGSVFVGGALVQWLRDEMRLIKTAKQTEEYASKVEDTNGVYIVPAFVGLGAPYWDSNARGTIVGLTRGTTKEHFIRAGLEAIAYQVYDIYHAMENDLGTKLNSLNVDGGASANNFLLQFQSDILNTDVVRPKVVEVTALGASYLAGLNVGYWKDIEDIRTNKQIERVFTPTMDDLGRDTRIKGWEKSIKMARYND